MIINVCEFLKKSVNKYPKKTAFVCKDENISYLDFDILSDKLASEILHLNLTNEPVLIILSKNISTLIAIFGVIKSGNFYTLIDDKTPIKRILKIVDILKPKLILSSIKLDLNLKDLGIKIIFCEKFSNFKLDINSLNLVQNRHIDTNLLYVFFTSGSTGEPKGVCISHKSVIDYTFWVVKTFNVNSKEIIANQAPFYFDNSILDIFSTIASGATLHILPNNEFSFPNLILEYLQRHKVSMIFWVPSVLIYFANIKSLDNFNLRYLKKVLFCGEIMPNKQLNIWRKHLKSTLFANLYGPTEITDVCSYYICNRNFKNDEILPIGNACRNTELLVFDENLSLVDSKNIGIKGELYVRGSSLSLGYYSNNDVSKKAFLQNPLHKNYRDLLYKTGDIVAYNEFGELICYGRIDNQIKIMGHRVELGEIEAILNANKNLLIATCIFKYDRIICFYEADKVLNLKEYLLSYLPSYMIPKKFILIKKLPLNDNGKIDKKALYEAF